MTRSLADNAIDLLIELAESGEIDPWDVKVIEVIDRFLSKLQPERSPEQLSAVGRAPYEADLSESGQAFLYASMLLLLKADSLARLESEQEVEDGLEEVELDAEVNALPRNLERRIRRRAVAPAAPNRRVTLQELIAQLNLISSAMTDQKPRRVPLRRPRPQSQRQAIRAIAQLAHQENLLEVAAALDQFLNQYWEDLDQKQNWLDFEVLLQLWTEAQPLTQPEVSSVTPTVHDRVGAFWALLFLSSQSKVELAQQEFYQDLQVRSLADLLNEAAPKVDPALNTLTTLTSEDLALLD
ncbi:MAG TPA: segregation/condensation protein A [Coleofasciculaceae cyanobacterium]|jgi:segregation and condensation protein A